MSTPRDPITTHILDSTTGLPAAGVAVTLTHLSQPTATAIYHAQTSPDGRITAWQPLTDTIPLDTRLSHMASQEPRGRSVWSLKFDTESYWGVGRTFYPEVEVRFVVGHDEFLYGRDASVGSTGGGGSGPGAGEAGPAASKKQRQKQRGHWHVPVLLGPWSYTTYRGS